MKRAEPTTVVNLTPHEVYVRFLAEDGRTSGVVFPPSGKVARVDVQRIKHGYIHGVPAARTTFGPVLDLPEPVPGTYYLVSALVRQAVPYRSDVVSPGELLRNPDGSVAGCRNFDVN